MTAACTDGDEGEEGFPARCALLTPEPGLDEGAVPTPFLLEGVQTVKVHETNKRLTLALNVPLPVADAFQAYKRAARQTGYEIVGQDNEGFEAEIYLRKGKQLGSIQIRTSRCPEATVVFVNIVQT